jgi:hypothetical protein
MYGLLNKNIRITITSKNRGPCTMVFLDGQGGYFEKLLYGFETLDMTSAGLGGMFEGDL